MSEEHLLPVTRTARYMTFGNPVSATTEQIWVACHGYGQNVGRFIKKFDQLDTSKHRIIAPEGLSRFYWSRDPLLIGASWMTKEKRLTEIDDYCNFLDTVYEREVAPFQDTFNGAINFFGFSQGCATICRWMHARRPRFDRLILWAGQTPEDIAYNSLQEYLDQKDQWFIYGTQDEFLTEKRLSWQTNFAREQGFRLQIRTFEGPHAIHRPTLQSLVDQWNKD